MKWRAGRWHTFNCVVMNATTSTDRGFCGSDAVVEYTIAAANAAACTAGEHCRGSREMSEYDFHHTNITLELLLGRAPTQFEQTRVIWCRN